MNENQRELLEIESIIEYCIVYLKFVKKVDLMCSYHTHKINNYNKGGGKKLWEVVDIYGLDGDDGFIGKYLSPNPMSYILNMYHFVYDNYISIKCFLSML